MAGVPMTHLSGCLETQNRVAVLERPNDCGSEEHCISACPEDAIHMVWLPAEGNHSIGLWRSVAHMNPEFGSSGVVSPIEALNGIGLEIL